MNTRSVEMMVGAVLVALGLGGLYYHVEYSGWVLFFGLMAMVN